LFHHFRGSRIRRAAAQPGLFRYERSARHTFGAHLARKGEDMAIIRNLLGHHSMTLTERYHAHLASSNLSLAVQKLQQTVAFIKNLLPKTLPKIEITPFSGSKNGESEVLLTDSFPRCYVPEVALHAGVAKLAYAADSKWKLCSFCPLLNSLQPIDPAKQNDLDALKPYAGLLGNF
jgi:hypothetical protein